jgi:hypothetical protein
MRKGRRERGTKKREKERESRLLACERNARCAAERFSSHEYTNTGNHMRFHVSIAHA